MLSTLLFLPLVEKVALVGGLLHTMVPGAAPVAGTILIDSGMIEAIGANVELPAGTRRIEIAGKHVIPGLTDGMVSFDADHDRLYLSCGVTFVRETGGDLTQMLAERDSQARDRNPGPALWIAGAVLDGNPPVTRSAVVMTTREEAVDKASRMLDTTTGSVDYFATHLGLPEPAWKAVIDFAHKQPAHCQVWGPLPRGITLEQALAAGQDGLFYLEGLLPAGKTWTSVTAEELAAVAKRVGEAHMAVTPTLALYASRLLAPADKPPELKYLGPIQVAQWQLDFAQRQALFTDPNKPDLLKHNLEELKQRIALLTALYENHVTLVPGSCCGLAPWLMPGEALLDELSLWAGNAGIPLPEVLAMATRGSAERIGALALHGTLEKGKWADLVVTDADPTKDLRTLRKPAWVVVRGRPLSAAEIEDMLGQLAKRQKQLQALAMKPLQLDPPPAPPGELQLSGLVETRFGGQRISGESYAVSRMSDGTMVYASRMLTFGTATTADTECLAVQKILNGHLVDVNLTVSSPPRVVTLEGTLAGGTLNIERKLNGVHNDLLRVRENAAFLDYGSVLTDLILGQSVKPGEFGALFLQDFEVASSSSWDLRVDPASGQHLLRGPLGDRVIDFAPDGAVLKSVREGGRSELVTTSLEDKAVKSGLPVPKKTNPEPPKKPK